MVAHQLDTSVKNATFHMQRKGVWFGGCVVAGLLWKGHHAVSGLLWSESYMSALHQDCLDWVTNLTILYLECHYWITVVHQECHGSLGYFHDDVFKWKHFPRYWPFVRGIHRSPVNSAYKGQWRGAFMFSFSDLRLNKRLSKQWWGWWFVTPSSPL